MTTSNASLAELLFNDGFLTRLGQKSTFTFLKGKRKVEQMPNLIYLITGCDNQISTAVKLNKSQEKNLPSAKDSFRKTSIALTDTSSAKTETILATEGGRALVVSFPNSELTQIETPQSQIDIRGSASQTSSDILSPLEQSGAVLIAHNAESGKTEVLALTDGDIRVSDTQGRQTVALQGGEMVAVDRGRVEAPVAVRLSDVYKNDGLLLGLGPGEKHDQSIEQAPPGVQLTLKVARARTLAALENQEYKRRIQEFKDTFIGRRTGLPTGFGPRLPPPPTEVTVGTFERTGTNTATFTDGRGKVTPIDVDFGARSISINGQSGSANSAGLSGNNAVGTVLFPGGQETRVEVIGVNGKEPGIGARYQGTLSTRIAPDR